MTDMSGLKIKQVKLTKRNKALLILLDTVTFPNDCFVEFEDKQFWWIAYLYERPVGFACVEYAGYCNRGFLSRAGVIEEFRGKGIQRKLIRVREKFARSKGWRRLITYTTYENIASANNLIRCGYLLYTPADEWGSEQGLYFYKDV